ncbi:HAD family hydrolase [Micromonospora sp. NPDC092111]|uniref:HAD family hydrolase n=1 Tax=Micromonospora sp. NPDC092111 TaxID=3364289 RepID=UPI003823AE72
MTPPAPVRGVVFDLDGTLVDSWPLHQRCLRAAAAAVGLAGLSAARLAAAQRPTDVDTVRAVVGPDRFTAAWPHYRRELHAALAAGPVPPMPHVRQTVRALLAADVVVGLCTGRTRADAVALLAASGLPVEVTVAREDAARPKPAPDGLLAALRRLGLAPHETRYLGDTAADVAQGAAAGVPTALVRRAGDLARAIHSYGLEGLTHDRPQPSRPAAVALRRHGDPDAGGVRG